MFGDVLFGRRGILIELRGRDGVISTFKERAIGYLFNFSKMRRV